MAHHGSASREVRQFAEFSASVARHLPGIIKPSDMHIWNEHPKTIAHALKEGFLKERRNSSAVSFGFFPLIVHFRDTAIEGLSACLNTQYISFIEDVEKVFKDNYLVDRCDSTREKYTVIAELFKIEYPHMFDPPNVPQKKINPRDYFNESLKSMYGVRPATTAELLAFIETKRYRFGKYENVMITKTYPTKNSQNVCPYIGETGTGPEGDGSMLYAGLKPLPKTDFFNKPEKNLFLVVYE